MTGRGDRGGRNAAGGPARHVPVLLQPVLTALSPRAGERYIDGTFGAGGYSRAILAAADCRVLGIDRDPDVIATGQAIVNEYAGRLRLIRGEFGRLDEIAEAEDFFPADGAVLDIGVSSMQLDEPERGFSFMVDGPLDMRMARAGPSAADFVNTADEAEIADVIWRYGEERRSRAVARAIVARRAREPFERTLDLAAVVARAAGRRDDGKHAATRSFQAFRIHINDELGELERGLAAAERALAPGGRLVVVTFHSLEDRIVKAYLRDATGHAPRQSRYQPDTGALSAARFRFVNKQPVSPDDGELAVNPRARSARMRWAVRTDVPAASPDPEDGGSSARSGARRNRRRR